VAARAALDAMRGAKAPWRDLDLQLTTAPGDARRMAREAAEAGFDAVVAVGGDGTANEAAWGLLRSPTALGLVPAGSGNGLARTLRIPLRPVAAVRALRDAVVRRMDVGMANGRPFLNVAGAGFDAVVGAAFHEWGRAGGRRGLFSYFRLAVPRALSYRSSRWTLAAGDEGFSGPAFLVAFVNGRQYGGAAVIAPGARLDDGLLEIVVVEDAPAFELLANAPRLFVGGIEGFRRYRRIAAARAVLTGPAAFEHHRDGEPEPPSERLEVTLEAGALAVLVPRPTADDPDGPFVGDRR
jgi:YegS/Rv2252/BmrU family lipid kinase